MVRSQFAKNVRFIWKGQVYIVEEELEEARLLLRNISHGSKRDVVRLSELLEAYRLFQVVFEISGENVRDTEHTKDSPPNITTEYAVALLQYLPTGLREETLMRYEAAQPLYDRPDEERTRKKIEAYWLELRAAKLKSNNSEVDVSDPGSQKMAFSARTLERWVNALVESAGDPRALVPKTNKQGKPSVSRLGDDLEDIIKRVFNFCAKHRANRSVEDIRSHIHSLVRERNKTLEQLGLETHEAPVYSTIYNRLQQTGNPDLYLTRAPSAVEAKANQGVLLGPQPIAIGERIEIDSTTLDIELVDPIDREPIGRPTLSLGLDKYHEDPWGFSLTFIDPGYLTSQLCMLHGLLPKPNTPKLFGTKNHWEYCGIPMEAVTDNGPEYYNSDLECASKTVGFNWIRTPREAPWWRASIERFMRTVNESAVHKLPGTTYSNVVQRGDYDSENASCMSIDAFYRWLHIWFMDVHCEDWHKLKGGTVENFMGGIPSRLRRRSQQMGFGLPLHNNPEELPLMLLPSDRRVLQRVGIEHDHITYQSQQLIAWRSRRPAGEREVIIKYDLLDRNYIYVINPDDPTDYLCVPSAMPEYTYNLPDWRHRKYVKRALALKGSVDYDGLVDARHQLERIAVEEYRRTRRVRTRKTAARFIGRDMPDMAGTSTSPHDSQLPKPAARRNPSSGAARDASAHTTVEGRNTPPDHTKSGSPVASSNTGQEGTGDHLDDVADYAQQWSAGYSVAPLPQVPTEEP